MPHADAAPLNVASTDLHPRTSLGMSPGDYQTCVLNAMARPECS